MGSARIRFTKDELLRLGLPIDATIVSADMGPDRSRGELYLSVEHPSLSMDKGEGRVVWSRFGYALGLAQED